MFYVFLLDPIEPPTTENIDVYVGYVESISSVTIRIIGDEYSVNRLSTHNFMYILIRVCINYLSYTLSILVAAESQCQIFGVKLHIFVQVSLEKLEQDLLGVASDPPCSVDQIKPGLVVAVYSESSDEDSSCWFR